MASERGWLQASYSSVAEIVIIAQHQHFAPAAVFFGRADDAFLFHLIDQARGPRVADAQLPLQQRDAGFLLQSHDVDGALQQIIFTSGIAPVRSRTEYPGRTKSASAAWRRSHW